MTKMPEKTPKKFTARGASRGHRGAGAKGADPKNAPAHTAHAAHAAYAKNSAPAARKPHAKPGKPVTPAAVTPNRKTGFAGGGRPYDYSAYESEPATPEYMARLFARHSFSVTKRQLEQFWLHYDLLRRENARLDLTRIMGIEATVLKHFVDSAILLRWFDPVGPVLDIGSGPGFPGVPLAVMRPDVRFILGESRGKRVGFLEDVIKTLKLSNCEIFSKSVREDSPLGDDHGKPIGDVVTRALETIAPTLERILPFINPGRRAVFMKGPGCDGEIAAASSSFSGVYKLTADERYALPGTDQGRRLVIFEKCALK